MVRTNSAATILLVLCVLLPGQSAHPFDWSHIRVVSLYESIIDTNTATLITRLMETHTDFVFRAYFRGFQRDLNASDYHKLTVQISAIKAALPWIRVMAGISCSVVYFPGDSWPNGSLISQEESLKMFWTLPNGKLAEDPSYPWPVLDITKSLAKQFIETYAFKLIDAGVDSLFFDEINIIPQSSPRYGLNVSEAPYVEAWRQIASSVKDYALREYGKDLPVTLNSGYVNAAGQPPLDIWPYQDFITVGINPDTVRTESIKDDWAGLKARVMDVYGHLLPIMAFIDWGPGETPLSIFASLAPIQQIMLLKLLHDTAVNQDFLLVYPLRGGAINGSIRYVDYNNTYDSVKEGTFDTIVQLSETPLISTQTSASQQTPLIPALTAVPSGLAALVVFIALVLLWFVASKTRRKELVEPSKQIT